ncbi:MAG: DUF1232 domain-containing protein [Muribaculaceae bacterium]|nr:DUF1232 domain-containing protein [Muribaculaceae bacterium]MDE6299383.1 DUF1232 domain-containing protein [Muribaculaceae bacterium]
MDLNYFKEHLNKFASYYNPDKLIKKIKDVAKKAGLKTIYIVLILYYATFDKSLPIKDRLMVAAALGYFILPLDFIPDAIPGGFADDAAALLYVVKHIWGNLSEDTFSKARQRLKEWFPDSETPEINI